MLMFFHEVVTTTSAVADFSTGFRLTTEKIT